MDKHCKGCVYYGGHSEPAMTCNYLFTEDRVRPCPPGAKCTVKIMRNHRKTVTDKERDGKNNG